MAYALTDEQREQYTKLGWGDSRFEALRVECSRQEMPEDVWLRLVWIAIELGDFERLKWQILSPSKEADAINAVEEAARALSAAIERLPFGIALNLNQTLFLEALSLGDDRAVIASSTDPTVDQIQRLKRTIADLSGAAATVAAQHAEAGTRGRPRLQSRYAGYIASVAHVGMHAGLVPGGGGDFERLTDALFGVAGVPAKTAGHVRYFMDHMHEGYKARGLSL